jgi:signal transduction histidine kinase
LGVRLADPSFLARTREAYFDILQQLQPRTETSAALQIIEIDNVSLAAFGQWPWPRATMAQLIDQILAQKPNVLGISILFSETDRVSAKNILSAWPNLDAQSQRTISSLPDGDAILEQALQGNPVVLGVALDTPMSGLQTSADQAADPKSPSIASLSFPNFKHRIDSLPSLVAASAGIGAVTVQTEFGVVRKSTLAFEHDAKIVPSLATEMMRVAAGGTPIRFKVDDTKPSALKIGQSSITTDETGSVRLYFSKRPDTQFISAYDVLMRKISPKTLEEKMVLIAPSAVGLGGSYVTPLGELMTGAELHGQILDNLVTGLTLRRPIFLQWLEILIPVIVCGFCIWATRRLRVRWIALISLTGMMLIVTASWFGFSSFRLLISPIFAMFSLVTVGSILATAGIIAARRAAEEKAQNREQRLRALQFDLERRSRSAGFEQLSYALAHELNQPLHAISNFVQASRRLVHVPDPNDSGKVDRYLEKAINEVRRAAAIVTGLRDLVQTGETQRQSDDLNDIVQESVDAVAMGQARSKIKIKYELTPDLPKVLVNRIQVQQVLHNLVRNAFEAMQARGYGTLIVRTLPAQSNRIGVEVEDDGPAIDDAAFDALFTPFVSTKENGMGVGLAISKAILEAHEGALSARRRVEGGLIFSFSVPTETNLEPENTRPEERQSIPPEAPSLRAIG